MKKTNSELPYAGINKKVGIIEGIITAVIIGILIFSYISERKNYKI